MTIALLVGTIPNHMTEYFVQKQLHLELTTNDMNRMKNNLFSCMLQCSGVNYDLTMEHYDVNRTRSKFKLL
jgi:hypothetical protein